MKKFLTIFALVMSQTFLIGQTRSFGTMAFHHPDNSIVHADGIFRYFTESDYEIRLGNMEEAILKLDMAIAQNPFFAESYLKRSTVLARYGRYNEAERDFETAQQLNPYLIYFQQSANNLNRLELMAFDYEQYHNELKARLPDHLSDQVPFILDQKLKGNPGPAMRQLNTLMNDSPTQVAALYELRANLYFLMEQYELAFTDYTKAIQLNPMVAEYYYNRGVTQLFTYFRSAACEDLEKSDQMGFQRSKEKLKYFCYN